MKDTFRCEICWMAFNLKFLSKKVLDSRKIMTVNFLPELFIWNIGTKMHFHSTYEKGWLILSTLNSLIYNQRLVSKEICDLKWHKLSTMFPLNSYSEFRAGLGLEALWAAGLAYCSYSHAILIFKKLCHNFMIHNLSENWAFCRHLLKLKFYPRFSYSCLIHITFLLKVSWFSN